MANLNLSQFTEKTLVADADWVFVWDTDGAISKKVSRNSLLNSGTLATSAPVTISQTWDGTGSTVFTGLNIGITDTNSAATSSLFSVKRTVGVTTSTLFSVEKEKIRLGALGYYTESGAVPRINSAYGFYVSTGGSDLNFNFVVNNDNSVNIGGFQNGARLYKDGNHQLGLRDGAAAQTFNVYGTYTSATSYERLTLSAPSAANAIIGTNKGSGGGTARGLEFQTDGVTRMTIATNGLVTIPVSIVVNSAVRTGFINNVGDSLSMFSFVNDSTGTSTYAVGGSAPLMRFGGTTNSFPAIARDGAGIKFTGAAAGLTSHIKVPAVAVLSLPDAATAGVGARAFVNDALAPVFGSTVANGGAVAVPVYSDGSAWYVG